MKPTYANNETAAKYKELIDSIEWGTDNQSEQLAVMQKMRTMLLNSDLRTPILDWHSHDIHTGARTITTAGEKLDQITTRIERFVRMGVTVNNGALGDYTGV